MGIFQVAIQVGNPEGGDPITVPEAVIDIGASHSMLPESLLTALHLEPRDSISVTFADGSREHWAMECTFFHLGPELGLSGHLRT